MNTRITVLALCLALFAIPSISFAAKTHKVKKSETLFSIARKYHVSVDELKGANNIVNSHLKPGVVLLVPPRSAAGGDDSARKEAGDKSSYKVRKGDTLARIAKKTGVSVADLKRLNALKGKKLKPGLVIALREVEPVADSPQKSVKRVSLRNPDLFNEKEYERSLAELMEADSGTTVDLDRKIELRSDSVSELKKTAFSFLGARYRFGGNSRNSLDCSSFVQQVFREMEVSLPRTAREQFEVGNEVMPGDLQKGDLVFFHTYASFPSHVGIYLGNNKMIHASSRDRRVVISTMNTPYYRARFIGAKRIAKINPEVFKLDDLFMGVEEENLEDILGNDTLGLTLNN